MVMRTWSLTAPHGPAGSFVVSVSVTPPAAISPAEGVYVAFRVDALGANVPAPPDHVPVVAAPPTAPASCTCGALAHTARSAPASAVAAGGMVMCTVSPIGPHGPAGSFVVRVSVTPPAAISPALGVYVAF